MSTKNVLIAIMVFVLISCKHSSENPDTKTPHLQLNKIECIEVLNGGSDYTIYTIQNDSLYFGENRIKIDKQDVFFINSKLEMIDSLKKYRTGGACIENDASGLVYQFWINDTVSEWISCFSTYKRPQTEQIKLINILDKYFYYTQNKQGANLTVPTGIEIFNP